MDRGYTYSNLTQGLNIVLPHIKFHFIINVKETNSLISKLIERQTGDLAFILGMKRRKT